MMAGPSASAALQAEGRAGQGRKSASQHTCAQQMCGREKARQARLGAHCPELAAERAAQSSLEVLTQANHGRLAIVGVDLQSCIHAHSKTLQRMKWQRRTTSRRCAEDERRAAGAMQREVLPATQAESHTITEMTRPPTCSVACSASRVLLLPVLPITFT